MDSVSTWTQSVIVESTQRVRMLVAVHNVSVCWLEWTQSVNVLVTVSVLAALVL